MMFDELKKLIIDDDLKLNVTRDRSIYPTEKEELVRKKNRNL